MFRYFSILIAGAVVLYTVPVAPCGSAEPALVNCEAFDGAVLVKQTDGWKSAKVGERIDAGRLIVALPKASFRSSNGAVEMRLFADIGQRGPYPVLESAVTINKNAEVDLDVHCDRGIVVFVNRKEAGAAAVAVRFRDQVWNLTLRTPKSRVGLEVYSRHLPGLPKISDGKVAAPTTYIVLLVAEGEVFLDTSDTDFVLHAPPGPARVHWDSISAAASVERLERLPESITRPASKDEEKLFRDICACAGMIKDGNVGKLLDQFLASDKKVDRLVGVTAMGAIDDLPRLIRALANEKHADIRQHAVLVLRNWMGRSTGQVEQLYKSLKEDGKYSDVHARSLLQLLFGFSQHDRFDPSTYDLLTLFLGHPQLAIRELAHWHLVRLMPEGKNIMFDAAAPDAQRQRAVREWQALIQKSATEPNN